jgi:hypothetical protein
MTERHLNGFVERNPDRPLRQRRIDRQRAEDGSGCQDNPDIFH